MRAAPQAGDAERLANDGATVIFVAIDGRFAGLLGIADPVKASAAGALGALRNDGIRIVMLTGDNRTTAEAVARRLGHHGDRSRHPARAKRRDR